MKVNMNYINTLYCLKELSGDLYNIYQGDRTSNSLEVLLAGSCYVRHTATPSELLLPSK